MCELLSLFSSLDAILCDLDTELREAEDASPHENAGAGIIQRVFRGWATRMKIFKKGLAALMVQRVFRGHSGRNCCRRKAYTKMEDRKLSVFIYFALQLQKTFRGYYSRKYRQNHATRKKYLQDVVLAGQQVRQNMKEYEKQQNEYEIRQQEIQQEKEFKYLSENLHHLVSTKHIRGVYNPHAPLMEKPMANEVPVEECLRGAVKDLIRTRGLTKKNMLTRDLNGTLRVPVKGRKHRLSLQASVPYDVLEKERHRQRVLHDLMTKDKGTFHTGGRTDVLEQTVPPLCADDPYMDQWSNPLLKRGVPRDQAHLIEVALSRTTAPTFVPAPERPFYVTGSGNKSAVLANDLFDTIAEAEESGGVTRRHLSSTTRYGLSENCDDRIAGGDLPAPPVKAATLLPTTRTVRAHKMMTAKLNATAPAMRSAPSSSSGRRPGGYADSSDEDD